MKTYRETMREMERMYLRSVLAESRNITQAAAMAGLSRSHLYALMRRAGIRRSARNANRGNALWQSLTGTMHA